MPAEGVKELVEGPTLGVRIKQGPIPVDGMACAGSVKLSAQVAE
jgi:hypothetical protein